MSFDSFSRGMQAGQNMLLKRDQNNRANQLHKQSLRLNDQNALLNDQKIKKNARLEQDVIEARDLLQKSLNGDKEASYKLMGIDGAMYDRFQKQVSAMSEQERSVARKDAEDKVGMGMFVSSAQNPLEAYYQAIQDFPEEQRASLPQPKTPEEAKSIARRFMFSNMAIAKEYGAFDAPTIETVGGEDVIYQHGGKVGSTTANNVLLNNADNRNAFLMNEADNKASMTRQAMSDKAAAERNDASNQSQIERAKISAAASNKIKNIPEHAQNLALDYLVAQGLDDVGVNEILINAASRAQNTQQFSTLVKEMAEKKKAGDGSDPLGLRK